MRQSVLHRLLRNRLTMRYLPFYRRYPFSSPVSIVSADKRGCVDLELGIFYNRVPKAANSSVVVNLAQQKLGYEIESKPAKCLFRRPSSLSNREMAGFGSLYRFTFVRNPYVRVLSAYLDKIERKAAQGNGKAISFSEFLRQLERGDLYRNAHWAPQASLLLLPVTEYDFIGRVESLERDLAAVLATLQGRPGDRPPRSALGNWTGAGGRLAQYYDDDSLAIVRRLYARDFEAFGYEPAIDLQPA